MKQWITGLLLISASLAYGQSPTVTPQPALPQVAENPAPGRHSTTPPTPETPEPEQKLLSVGFEADVNSRYVFRGIEASLGPVFQPSAWIGYGPFRFNVWANSPLTSEPNQGQFNEVDLSLGYGQQIGSVTLETGLLHYSYPNTDYEGTTELGVKLSQPLGSLTLFTAHALDVAADAGAYYGEVGLQHDRQLTERLGRSASISLGWATASFNKPYIGASKTALNVLNAQISWTYTARSGVYVRPHLGFSTLIDGDLRRSVSHPTLFSLGLAVGREF